MDKLFTWFDVETVIKNRMYAGEWPETMIDAEVFPDEVQIRIKTKQDQPAAANALKQWLKSKYSPEENKIFLESAVNGEQKFLETVFEPEPDDERPIPENMKPDFASFSLYPENPQGLKGPDFGKIAGAPSIWVFYSFKGGVGRTLHAISMIKALSELEPPKKALIIDADLEAPGLTWWAEDETGKAEISLLDFLALAHYDESQDYQHTMELMAERLRRQTLTVETKKTRVEHFLLPSFRGIQQLMRMPIRPEHVCWESGKEWLIAELLWKLGKKLNVDVVIADLRAGLSEISGPLLFDPRINRVIVTTPSGQSVQGTKKVLEQIGKISKALEEKTPDIGQTPSGETIFPLVFLSMIKEDLRQLPEMEDVRQELKQAVFMKKIESNETLDKEDLRETLFDENLLYLKSLKSTLDKLDKSDLHAQMTRFVAERFPTPPAKESPAPVSSLAQLREDLDKLKNEAHRCLYAEKGTPGDFLPTKQLKALARKFADGLPTAVLMGGKGAGKTYTYLRLTHLKEWSEFVERAINSKTPANDLLWPLIIPRNIEKQGEKTVAGCLQYAAQKTGLPFNPFWVNEMTTQIDQFKKNRENGVTDWRDFWIRLMAQALSCPDAPNPLKAIQEQLENQNRRIIFLVDGLEDRFQNVGGDEQEQRAIRALCQDVVEILGEWPGNRAGLLVFIRKDLARTSIKQNFGQFEARHESFELKWDRAEALRLAAWLVQKGAGLPQYLKLPDPRMEIEDASTQAVEEALEGVWGLKLGSPGSREAYTSNWIIHALADFKGQLQARDMVRLIAESAKSAHEKYANKSDAPEYEDRLLPPFAIRSALEPCSKKKIGEISQEVLQLASVFEKLKKIPENNRKIPFSKDAMGLDDRETAMMIELGVALEENGEYYMPEIFRTGLGFNWSGPGRSKVLWLQKKALRS